MVLLLLLLSLLPIHSFTFYEYPFDPPLSQLKEINTSNFTIIYSPSSEQQAFEIATFAEEEFESLTNYYGIFELREFIPNQKIRIIVSSDYQLANGFASLLQIPTMHLYTKVPPAMSDSHSYTQPAHLRSLFRHELTHIITLAIRKIFKKYILINRISHIVNPTVVFTARSFMEGSAIARESDGDYGRLKDPFTYHQMRRDLLDDKFPSFSQISGAHTGYSKGTLAYTYGALFNKYLSQNISTNIDKEYWTEAGNWKISSWALNTVTQKKQKELWTAFQNELLPSVNFITNTNALLSTKDRRIHSLQQVNDKIYYFNQQNKELRAYNLTSKKDTHVVFANYNWRKVMVSPDEKQLLVSGLANKKTFVILLENKTLVALSQPYVGFDDASFLVDTTTSEPKFVAINRNSIYPELVVFQNQTKTTLYKGSSIDYFDSPISIDDQFIYFLHSYNGDKKVSRIDRNDNTVTSLNMHTLNFPRFLTGQKDSISVSFAPNTESFYSRAIISNNTIQLINDNIKGEIFDSVIDSEILYYKSSFSAHDNIMSIPLSELNIMTQPINFTSLAPLLQEDYSYKGDITPYKATRDLSPLFWIPILSTREIGIQNITIDSVGANVITTGVAIEYTKGTPEFMFNWQNKELPIEFNVFFNNYFLPYNGILQLREHHLLRVGFSTLYSHDTYHLEGTFTFSSALSWQGRLTGDPKKFTYTWNHLAFQQIIGATGISWRQYASEGAYGFYRNISLALQHHIDYLNTKWQRITGIIEFSPPILPIDFNFYVVYDTSRFSIYGSSALGGSAVPQYKEYIKYNIYNDTALYGSIDIMLYSWEIQNGVGFGELFFHRWAFFTGYRAGYWGDQYPYLHSIYFKSNLDVSLLFGTVPISFVIEGNYAITTKEWGYDLYIQSGISY